MSLLEKTNEPIVGTIFELFYDYLNATELSAAGRAARGFLAASAREYARHRQDILAYFLYRLAATESTRWINKADFADTAALKEKAEKLRKEGIYPRLMAGKLDESDERQLKEIAAIKLLLEQLQAGGGKAGNGRVIWNGRVIQIACEVMNNVAREASLPVPEISPYVWAQKRVQAYKAQLGNLAAS